MSSVSAPPDPIYVLRGVGASITALEFSKNVSGRQNKLLSGDATGQVCVWNLARKRVDKTLDGHSRKSILNVCYLNENQVLSQGRDGKMQIWKLLEEKSEITSTIPISDLGFCKCETSTDKDHMKIAVASEEQSQVDIIDVNKNEISMKLKPECEKTLGMCMCLKRAALDNNGVLFAGYENGDIILWDVVSAKLLHQLNVHKEPVMCVDFDPRTQRGVTGSADSTLIVFQLKQEGTLCVEKTVLVKNPGISAVKIRGDSKILTTGGWDSKIRIFSWKTLKPLAILNYHSKSVDVLAFSNCEEQVLAAGSKDGRISLWSLYKNNCS